MKRPRLSPTDDHGDLDARPLRTARLEAFSDGVFAIASTLLVLEISMPDDEPESPSGAVRLLSGCNGAHVVPAGAHLSYDMVMPVEPGTRLRFLSDEWRAAVREMSDEQLAGSVVDQPGLVVNATVTDVPFGERTLHLHSDRGPVVGWQPGHSPEAAFEIHVDYHVAKALVLDATATADALVQGFATHAVEVSGDASQYRHWWQARLGHHDSVELEDRIRAITS